MLYEWSCFVSIPAGFFVTTFKNIFSFTNTYTSHVLMAWTFKSALTNRLNCKACFLKTLCRKKIDVGRKGQTCCPLRDGLVLLDFWGEWCSRLEKCSTDKGQEVNSKSKEEKGVRTAGYSHPPPPPCTLLWLHLLHVTSGTEGSSSHSSGDEAAAALPAPAQLSLRKGSRRGGGERLPAELPLPRTQGVSRNQHLTVLTWRFPGSPRRSLKMEGKREEKPAESVQGWGGALKGTGEPFAKNPSCIEVFLEKVPLFASPLAQRKGASKDGPEAFLRVLFLIVALSPCTCLICWPFQKNLSAPSSSWEDSP